MLGQLLNVVDHDGGLSNVGKRRSCAGLAGSLREPLAGSVDHPEDGVCERSSSHVAEV